jgi:hypothetical protein
MRYYETPDVNREREPDGSLGARQVAILEAQTQLYRAQVYCDRLAYRQRSDAYRKNYNQAVNILRDLQRQLLREYEAL